MTFEGFDHIDVRVRSLASVESFYDALMPALGLTEKRYANVDARGEWGEGTEARHNVVEHYEAPTPGRARFFIGIIQDRRAPSATRIAFRVARRRFDALERLIRTNGAIDVERSADMRAYPAVFFSDPAGTRLELVARRAARS